GRDRRNLGLVATDATGGVNLVQARRAAKPVAPPIGVVVVAIRRLHRARGYQALLSQVKIVRPDLVDRPGSTPDTDVIHVQVDARRRRIDLTSPLSVGAAIRIDVVQNVSAAQVELIDAFDALW